VAALRPQGDDAAPVDAEAQASGRPLRHPIDDHRLARRGIDLGYAPERRRQVREGQTA
jgi:hypothetical protein